jgi:hypothetical protein
MIDVADRSSPRNHPSDALGTKWSLAGNFAAFSTLIGELWAKNIDP